MKLRTLLLFLFVAITTATATAQNGLPAKNSGVKYPVSQTASLPYFQNRLTTDQIWRDLNTSELRWLEKIGSNFEIMSGEEITPSLVKGLLARDAYLKRIDASLLMNSYVTKNSRDFIDKPMIETTASGMVWCLCVSYKGKEYPLVKFEGTTGVCLNPVRWMNSQPIKPLPPCDTTYYEKSRTPLLNEKGQTFGYKIYSQNSCGNDRYETIYIHVEEPPGGTFVTNPKPKEEPMGGTFNTLPRQQPQQCCPQTVVRIIEKKNNGFVTALVLVGGALVLKEVLLGKNNQILQTGGNPSGGNPGTGGGNPSGGNPGTGGGNPNGGGSPGNGTQGNPGT